MPLSRYMVSVIAVMFREGYKADLVLVSHGDRWEVNSENILSKCGWSPLEAIFPLESRKNIC